METNLRELRLCVNEIERLLAAFSYEKSAVLH
jgi:hypothetical protein